MSGATTSCGTSGEEAFAVIRHALRTKAASLSRALSSPTASIILRLNRGVKACWDGRCATTTKCEMRSNPSRAGDGEPRLAGLHSGTVAQDADLNVLARHEAFTYRWRRAGLQPHAHNVVVLESIQPAEVVQGTDPFSKAFVR
jgi:hypothetical protein